MDLSLLKENLNFILENNSLIMISSGIIIFGLTILFIYLLKVLIRKFVEKRMQEIAKYGKVEEKIERILKSIGTIDYILLPTFFVLYMLRTTKYVSIIIDKITLGIILFYITRIILIILNYIIQMINLKKEKIDKTYDPSLSQIIYGLISITLWVSAFLFYISNLGFNVSTLITGLGVGGIIIAFALQNVLSDIFAFFSINVDKPFKVGEFIIVEGEMGIVKKIGLKSTRIDHLNGQQLSIPNRKLTDSNIHNYSRLHKRRAIYKIGVTYKTSVEKLKKGLEIIKKTIEDTQNVTLDRVNFREFDSYSLNYEIVYFVNNPDFKTYLSIVENINLKIKAEFEKEKIEMAFPTQTIHVEK